MFNALSSCPAPAPTPATGTYQVLPPTTYELLVRLRRRLSEPHHPFHSAMEMARHRELVKMDIAVGRERMLASLASNRAFVAACGTGGTL